MSRIEIAVSPVYFGFIVNLRVDNTPAAKALLRSAGKPIPPPVMATALIDTGASICGVKEDLIRALALPSRSAQTRLITTAGGEFHSPDYYAGISVVDDPEIAIPFVRVCCLALGAGPFDMILGMNALAQLNWSYSRATQRLTLQKP